VSAKVTVRYFAAARAAAGFDDEIIALAPGTTVGALVQTLSERGDVGRRLGGAVGRGYPGTTGSDYHIDVFADGAEKRLDNTATRAWRCRGH